MSKSINQIFGYNLTTLLNRKNLQQAQFADNLGVSRASVSLWCQGKVIPHKAKIDKMCELLDCEYADLVMDSSIITPPKAEHSIIPLYNSVSAGNGFFAETNIEKYIAVDSSITADFAVIISGDSMIGAGINDGDIGFIKKHFTFTEGKIYAIWQIGEELSFLKRVYIKNNAYFLVSENPAYHPIIIENNEAFILGELIGLYKDII